MRMKENRKIVLDNDLLLFLLVFALIFIRYCSWGFQYYFQLDDYIQFHVLSINGFDTLQRIYAAGMLATRPIANILDVFFWSHFYSNMIFGVLLMSALYAGSAMMFRWVWKRHFGIGNIFLLLYALLPLGLEGVYWMSAATRVVVGLFFISAALVQFEKWCTNDKKHALVLYILLQFISCGFYEQLLILSVTSSVILAVLHFQKQRNRSLWGLISLLNGTIFFALTRILPVNTSNAARMDLVLPVGSYYWNTYLPIILNQMKSAFLEGGFYIIVKGFWRGILQLFSGGNYLYLIGIVVLSSGLFLAARKSESHIKNPVKGIITGVLLTAAPLSIFFVISNSWFSLRGTVATYCGIALMADIVFGLLFSRFKSFKTITATVVALGALVCCIASVSEIYDYRETTGKDQQVAHLLIEMFDKDGYLDNSLNVGIMNLKPSYLPNLNYMYHEHIHGVTESNWALQGIIESLAGPDVPSVSPLSDKPMYYPWNATSMRLDNFDVLYVYDGEETLTQVIALLRNEQLYELYDTAGNYIGYTWEENRYGYLELGEMMP